MINKAINFFEEEIVRLRKAPEINGCEMTPEWKEMLQIYNTAVEALRKQIPKKPKTDQYGYYVCPSCGADDYALMHDSNLANQYNHCHDCGQSLDWSDVI